MSTKRKICVVITARPSYSRIKSAVQAIDDHPDLELQLVIAASALLGRYGSAVKQIEKDGFKIIAKVFNVLEGGNLAAQAKTTGLGIIELTNVFENIQPDAVITVADRFETMSTAIAAAYLNIPLVHIQGGEVTGNIDEKVRHAITKLADIHLVSSKKAKERVIRMGENPEMVFLTGCPSIDIAEEVYQNSQLDFNPYKKYGGVGSHPDFSKGYLIVMQHPVTTEYEQSRKQVTQTLEVIYDLKIPTFWFWPNVDAGSDGTSNAIRSFRENQDIDQIHFFKNMGPYDFLRVLKNSLCLIGNSSVGIRESAYLGIPVVNIGSRQNGRERGMNVIDVDYNQTAIQTAILEQIENGHYTQDRIYGEGDAGKRIAEILVDVPLTYHKILNY
ncbi:MAG: UDP-hydrolyzing UDP-N-acetyl-D-glucosamine 2-epimerase [Maribacter sp.]